MIIWQPDQNIQKLCKSRQYICKNQSKAQQNESKSQKSHKMEKKHDMIDHQHTKFGWNGKKRWKLTKIRQNEQDRDNNHEKL